MAEFLDLPNEMILEIFKYLEANDRKIVRQVCRTFRYLGWDFSDFCKDCIYIRNEPIKESEFNFPCMYVKIGDHSLDNSNFLQINGSNITTLSFLDSGVIDLVPLLPLVPNLTCLSLPIFSDIWHRSRNENILTPRNIRYLGIYVDDPEGLEIISRFRFRNLFDLYLSYYDIVKGSNYLEILFDILKNSKNTLWRVQLTLAKLNHWYCPDIICNIREQCVSRIGPQLKIFKVKFDEET